MEEFEERVQAETAPEAPAQQEIVPAEAPRTLAANGSEMEEFLAQLQNKKEFNWKKFILRPLSYVVIAAMASALTLVLVSPKSDYSKLEELKEVILDYYVGDADEKYMEDMAASAMVYATGDQWSYYIPAEQMQSVTDQKENSYVGIGVTITILEEDQGFEVTRVEPGSPALEAGVRSGDVIVAVDGTRVTDVGAEKAQNMVSGEEGTKVTITVLRDGQELDLEMTRKKIVQAVATGKMVTDTIGYIRITNFNSRCAEETIALFEELEAQGAQAMIFDVRFNPGGYKDEMVKVLDYLLPEGVLFRSESYDGYKWEDRSDAACKNMPIAVLVNGESYSAAEFFAAALKEYDYAVTVGQPTTGKGYFQNTITLSDGSAVNLSVGKYYTPKGISLAEAGGIVPDITLEIDEQTMSQIYAQTLPEEEDEQLQAAITALLDGFYSIAKNQPANVQ